MTGRVPRGSCNENSVKTRGSAMGRLLGSASRDDVRLPPPDLWLWRLERGRAAAGDGARLPCHRRRLPVGGRPCAGRGRLLRAQPEHGLLQGRDPGLALPQALPQVGRLRLQRRHGGPRRGGPARREGGVALIAGRCPPQCRELLVLPARPVLQGPDLVAQAARLPGARGTMSGQTPGCASARPGMCSPAWAGWCAN